MTGINAYGVYIPKYRLDRKIITAATGWLGQARTIPGEKAVANYDEDSLTMAVAASMNCIDEVDRYKIDALYFASTSAPYRERESAAIIATALNLGPNIRTADLTNSLKVGTTALLAASEAVKSGGAEGVLVCSSDCRIGKPGGNAEILFGDGGAAFLMGNEEVLAVLEGSHSISYDFPDHWRSQFDRYDRALEDREIRDEGYAKLLPQVLDGLMGKYALKPKDVAKVIYPCLYPREVTRIGRKLGFEDSQIQESFLGVVGDTGTASPLIMLVAALDEAKPDDIILVASYGNGCTALWFRITPQIEKKRKGILKRYLDSKEQLTSYEKYVAFRSILPMETGMRGEVGPTYVPVTWRERDFIIGLVGSKCTQCGTPQLPPQRICANPKCGAIDEMEPYRFSDKEVNLFSYTEDNLASCMDPPQMYGMVDFDGGGRYIFDITDCTSGNLQVGMLMGVTFRRKYLDELRGLHGYFWKATPIRIGKGK